MTTTTTEARRALEEHGVAAKMAERLAASHTPDLIGEWCAYKQQPRNRTMGPGALINAIRYGAPPPTVRRPGQGAEQDFHRERDWVRTHLPDLCDSDGQPHHQALVAVMLLEHRHGKGRLSPSEHGEQIRQAVARFEAELAG
jgi:hypothetical protein